MLASVKHQPKRPCNTLATWRSSRGTAAPQRPVTTLSLGSSGSRPGRTASTTPRSTVTASAVGREHVRHARDSTPARASRRGADREPLRRWHAFGRPVHCEQRHELSRLSSQLPLAAEHVNARLAHGRVDLCARVSVRCEEERGWTAGGRAGRPRRRARGCERGSWSVARSSASVEVGRVLLLGMALDANPAASATATASGDAGVEVADRHGHVEAERERRARGPCRRRSPARRVARRRSDTRSRGLAPDTTTTISSDTPSSAGITQIRFCGSAALQSPPSPARLRRAPVTSGGS